VSQRKVLEMKAALCSVTLLLCVFLPLLGCNKTRSDKQSRRKNLTLLEGEYLSTTYIDELKATRSPLKAGSADRIDLIVVRRTDSGFQLDTVFNFHEGGDEFVIDSNGLVSPIGAGGTEVANLTATVLDDHTFQLGYASFKPANYVFVKNAGEYVSKAALVGRYKDRHGRGYEFTEDGWAVFPDRKFRFEVGLDHVFGRDFDYFDEKGDKNLKTWAFKWNHDTLEVFSTHEIEGNEEIAVADGRPIVSLHRM
jgi:hypothetical protein